MISALDLKRRFLIYLEQGDRLMEKKLFFALLHLLIIIPGVCAALGSKSGSSEGYLYKRWANKYLADPFLSGEEWYDIRCKLLHQGITRGKCRYEEYQFTQPDPQGTVLHKNVFDSRVIELDVGELWKEVKLGLEKWFKDIELDKSTNKNVEKHADLLIRTKTGNVFHPYISGPSLSVSASFPSKK